MLTRDQSWLQEQWQCPEHCSSCPGQRAETRWSQSQQMQLLHHWPHHPLWTVSHWRRESIQTLVTTEQGVSRWGTVWGTCPESRMFQELSDTEQRSLGHSQREEDQLRGGESRRRSWSWCEVYSVFLNISLLYRGLEMLTLWWPEYNWGPDILSPTKVLLLLQPVPTWTTKVWILNQELKCLISASMTRHNLQSFNIIQICHQTHPSWDLIWIQWHWRRVRDGVGGILHFSTHWSIHKVHQHKELLSMSKVLRDLQCQSLCSISHKYSQTQFCLAAMVCAYSFIEDYQATTKIYLHAEDLYVRQDIKKIVTEPVYFIQHGYEWLEEMVEMMMMELIMTHAAGIRQLSVRCRMNQEWITGWMSSDHTQTHQTRLGQSNTSQHLHHGLNRHLGASQHQ